MMLLFNSFEPGSLTLEYYLGTNFSLPSPHPTLRASRIVHNLDFVPTSFRLRHIKGYLQKKKKKGNIKPDEEKKKFAREALQLISMHCLSPVRFLNCSFNSRFLLYVVGLHSG